MNNMKSGIISFFKILLFFIILITFTVFMSNNSDFVRVNLAPFDYILEIKLFLLIIISFVLGILAMILFNLIASLFGLKEIFSYFKRKKMEKEINKLKTKYSQLESENE